MLLSIRSPPILFIHHSHIKKGENMKFFKTDYTKDYFWTKIDSITHKTYYYLKLNNQLIEVSKEVYDFCYNSYKKEIRDNKKRSNQLSLDNPTKEDFSYYDLIPSSINIEKQVLTKIQVEEILKSLKSFSTLEIHIFIDTYIHQLTQQEIADRYHISHHAVSKTLLKIKKFLHNSCKKSNQWTSNK